VAIVRLALRSLLNRRLTVLLTVLAISLSVALLLGVEKLRRDAKSAFANTISGTDLIVGARSGSIQLLLYTVFRIGSPTNNISWESYLDLSADPRVRWSVPISLGDSHRGFRVMGTTEDYFEHYRYGRERALAFAAGGRFDDIFEAVLGADVAAELGYRLGDEIVIAHGAGKVSLVAHDDKPFRVAGILAKTGTPVDRTVHVSLEGIEAIHVDWQAGAPIPGLSVGPDEVRGMDLTPDSITAFLVGLDSPLAIFKVQRMINEYRAEPLLAILPGVALQELWDLMNVAENALRAISAMVVVTGLLGMLTVVLSSLDERRREMAILRSVGARPGHVVGLFMSEAGTLALAGVGVGLGLLYGLVLAARPLVERELGLYLPLGPPSAYDWTLLGIIVAAGFLAGSAPAYRAYRYSLADGLSIRL